MSARERALVEARARRLQEGDAAPRPGTMWRPAVVLPAIGISLFLVLYVSRVGFLVLYFVSNTGYSPAEANGLASWYWGANIAAFVVAGPLSDRLRVRKPLLVLAAAVSVGTLVVFAGWATADDISRGQWVLVLVVLAASGAFVSSTWLALFTELVERLDPAAVARGMAVYGATLRAFAVGTLVAFMMLVTTPAVLVDEGPAVQRISATYAAEIATLQQWDPTTVATLRADPTDPAALTRAATELGVAPRAARAAVRAALAVPVDQLAYLVEHGPDVAAAARRGPEQWQRWWWICVVTQLFLVPLSWGMRGRWSPRAAARDAAAHQALVERELVALRRDDRPAPV